MTERRCDTCQWWDGKNRNPGWGQCRAKAPTVAPGDPDSNWPDTTSDDWCGEWEPRPAPKETT